MPFEPVSTGAICGSDVAPRRDNTTPDVAIRLTRPESGAATLRFGKGARETCATGAGLVRTESGAAGAIKRITSESETRTHGESKPEMGSAFSRTLRENEGMRHPLNVISSLNERECKRLIEGRD